MTQVQVAVVGAEQVLFDFDRLGRYADARTRTIVRHYGQLLRTAVMRAASGRPGPNFVTGDYRRSITVTFQSSAGGTYSAEVGTNAPQGRRLEFGFVGADSLGRVYNQPPYPHFGPGFDSVVPDFVAALDKAIDG